MNLNRDRQIVGIAVSAALGSVWFTAWRSAHLVVDLGTMGQSRCDSVAWLAPLIVTYAVAQFSGMELADRLLLTLAMLPAAIAFHFDVREAHATLALRAFYSTVTAPLTGMGAYAVTAVALGMTFFMDSRRALRAIVGGGLLLAAAVFCNLIVLDSWMASLDSKLVGGGRSFVSAFLVLQVSIYGPIGAAHAVASAWLRSCILSRRPLSARAIRLRSAGLFVACAGVVAAAFVLDQYVCWVWRLRPALLAEAKRYRETVLPRLPCRSEDIPIAELEAPLPGNAAADYMAAQRAYKTSAGEYAAYQHIAAALYKDDLDPKILSGFLKESRTMHLIKQGTAKRECRFPIYGEPDVNSYLEPGETQPEHTPYLYDIALFRGAVTALIFEGVVESKKDPSGSRRAIVQAVRLTNHLSQGANGYLNAIVANACRDVLLTELVKRNAQLGLGRYEVSYKTQLEQAKRYGDVFRDASFHIEHRSGNPYLLDDLLHSDCGFMRMDAQRILSLRSKSGNIFQDSELRRMRRKMEAAGEGRDNR